MPGKKARQLEEQKTMYIRVRLSPADFIAIQEKSRALGVSVSRLVRDSLLPEKEKPVEQVDHKPEPVKEITLPGYPGTFKIH